MSAFHERWWVHARSVAPTADAVPSEDVDVGEPADERRWGGGAPRRPVGKGPRAAIAVGAALLLVAGALALVSRVGSPHHKRAVAVVPAATDATLAWSVLTGSTTLEAVVAVPRHGRPVAIAIPDDVQLDLAGTAPTTAGAMGSVGPRFIEAAQSLLGRRIDHVVVSDLASVSTVVQRSGGITVEVESPFTIGTRSIPAGLQRLGGPAVASYLRAAPNTTDLFLRWQDLLDGFFAHSAQTQGDLGASDDLAAAMRIVRAAQGARAVALPTTNALDGSIRPNAKAVRSLVATRMRTAGGPVVRVVVINGSGAPGVGDALAVRLAPLGLEVISAQNDSKKDVLTQILASSDRFVPAALRVRSSIASGTVYLDAQPTGLADVTIVVGKDLSIG